MGHGVAVPHCRAKGLRAPALALGLSPDGVPFEAGGRQAVARLLPARLARGQRPATGSASWPRSPA
ncbi:MAG: PTS sugar transporter subunit IIA [Comamonadaceae bacterium]|nr:PTS sugar transporter subunit IIA [Comamonadaceae bacterium]